MIADSTDRSTSASGFVVAAGLVVGSATTAATATPAAAATASVAFGIGGLGFGLVLAGSRLRLVGFRFGLGFGLGVGVGYNLGLGRLFGCRFARVDHRFGIRRHAQHREPTRPGRRPRPRPRPTRSAPARPQSRGRRSPPRRGPRPRRPRPPGPPSWPRAYAALGPAAPGRDRRTRPSWPPSCGPVVSRRPSWPAARPRSRSAPSVANGSAGSAAPTARRLARLPHRGARWAARRPRRPVVRPGDWPPGAGGAAVGSRGWTGVLCRARFRASRLLNGAYALLLVSRSGIGGRAAEATDSDVLRSVLPRSSRAFVTLESCSSRWRDRYFGHRGQTHVAPEPRPVSHTSHAYQVSDRVRRPIQSPHPAFPGSAGSVRAPRAGRTAARLGSFR